MFFFFVENWLWIYGGWLVVWLIFWGYEKYGLIKYNVSVNELFLIFNVFFRVEWYSFVIFKEFLFYI